MEFCIWFGREALPRANGDERHGLDGRRRDATTTTSRGMTRWERAGRRSTKWVTERDEGLAHGAGCRGGARCWTGCWVGDWCWLTTSLRSWRRPGRHDRFRRGAQHGGAKVGGAQAILGTARRARGATRLDVEAPDWPHTTHRVRWQPGRAHRSRPRSRGQGEG
jgi:hypothetical protein